MRTLLGVVYDFWWHGLHVQNSEEVDTSYVFLHSSRWGCEDYWMTPFKPFSCPFLNMIVILNIQQNYSSNGCQCGILIDLFDLLITWSKSIEACMGTCETQINWVYNTSPKECFNCGSLCKLLSNPSFLSSVKSSIIECPIVCKPY